MVAVLVGLGTFLGVVALGLLWSRRRRGARPQADSAGGLDAEWIYGDRAEQPWVNFREREQKARLEAEAIIRDARARAVEILADAQQARAEVEAELARERADLAEKTKRLSDFLSDALEEVERTSNGSGTKSAHDLEELEMLHDELRDTE